MDPSELPPEVRLAEECSAALGRGDVDAARGFAEHGLQLATANRSPKWIVRFQNLLQMCAPHTPEPSSAEAIECSFCGHQSSAVTQVVAGPGVFICRQCVAACTHGSSNSSSVQRLHLEGVRCSFCNRAIGRDTPVFVARGNYICSGCVEVCVEIFADSRVMT